MFNNALTESLAADQVADCHIDCIECRADGCTGCPSAFCELPRLVEHCGEHMHARCVAAFDAHVTNACTGDVCNCPADGVPLAVDVEETTPVAPLSDRQIAALDPLGVFRRLAAVAALALACVSGVACAGKSPAAEVETVGTLAAGPSVYSQPVAHDAPPTLGFVAGSDDDAPGDVVTTETRANSSKSLDGSSDAAPEIEAKGQGIQLGGAR